MEKEIAQNPFVESEPPQPDTIKKHTITIVYYGTDAQAEVLRNQLRTTHYVESVE